MSLRDFDLIGRIPLNWDGDLITGLTNFIFCKDNAIYILCLNTSCIGGKLILSKNPPASPHSLVISIFGKVLLAHDTDMVST